MFPAFLFAFATGLASPTVGALQTTQSETLQFFQLDVRADGHFVPNSDWGTVKLTYMGQPLPMYFNLAVNGQWAVQNIAVMSAKGVGVQQSQDYSFSLGVPIGTDVRQIDFDYTLTPTTIPLMPTGHNPGAVQDRNYAVYSGGRGETMAVMPAGPLIGFLLCEETYSHKDFPNQQSGPKECVPTAVSNSIRFLNAKHGLGIADADSSVAKMKVATGWTAGGCDQDEWAKKKDKYCTLQATGGKPRLPIKTEKVNNTDPAKVRDAIRAGCDVELNTATHCVAVTGVALRCDGKYLFEVTHDTDQDNPNLGTTTETVVYSGTSAKMEGGGPWANGVKVKNFVIECPIKE